jgi:hypothetical protein
MNIVYKQRHTIFRVLPTLRTFTMSTKTQEPKIRRISPLSEDEAKWTTLQKIEVRCIRSYSR